MSVEKRAHEQLTRWIEHERKLVNYREIAREYRVHINTAKRILAEHYIAHPTLFPTYLLTGEYLPAITTYTDVNANSDDSDSDGDVDVMDVDVRPGDTKDGSGNGRNGKKTNGRGKDKNGYPLRDDSDVVRSGMILVGGKEEMEAKSPLFSPSTLHVQLYALSPTRIKDPTQYLLPLVRLRKYPHYVDVGVYGTIRGEFELEGAASKVDIVNLREIQGESSKSIPSAYTKPSTSATASSSTVKPKVILKEEAAGSRSRSGSEKPDVKEEDVAKTGSSGAGKAGVKVKTEKIAVEPKSKIRKKRLVDSDEGEEPEQEEGKADVASSSTPSASTKQPLGKLDSLDADRLAMEAMMQMSDELRPSSPMRGVSEEASAAGPSTTLAKSPASKKNKKRTSEAAENAASSADETGPKQTDGRVRKKRRTVKQVQSLDAKGYMVFEDVSGEESYSSDGTEDVKPTIAKKQTKGKKLLGSSASAGGSRAGSEDRDVKTTVPPPPAKTLSKASQSKKPGQQSLSSFFKKK